jgi:hypothetical protein
VLSQNDVQGNFAANANNAVEAADALCENGYKAMFADGVNRKASDTAYTGDGQIDWATDTWTIYVNKDDQLIWKTEGLNLLGVENGGWTNWAHAVSTGNNQNVNVDVWTGLAQDWTGDDGDCSDWTTTQQAQASWGNAVRVTADALRQSATACYIMANIYCVEQ